MILGDVIRVFMAENRRFILTKRFVETKEKLENSFSTDINEY